MSHVKKLQGLNMERKALHGVVLMEELAGPGSFISIVTFQVASKLRA
jgi:hypothetical protein